MPLLMLFGEPDPNPRTLFASGEQGAAYLPGDANGASTAKVNSGLSGAAFLAAYPTHTLYQDSNGTVPCVYPGDPCALILDSRKGGLGNLGANLITNSTFDSDISGWSTVFAGSPEFVWSSGKMSVTNASTNIGVQTTISSMTAGKWYLVEMDLSVTAGSILALRLGSPTSTGTWFNGAFTGTKLRMIQQCPAAGTAFVIQVLGGTTATFDNISVREIPGNHLYQTVSGSRGTLSREPESLAGTTGGKRNLLTRTEEFDNAAWVKRQSTISQNQIANPFNSDVTADLMLETAVTNNHRVEQSITVASGTVVVASFYVKAAGRNYCLLYDGNAAVGRYFSIPADGTGQALGNFNADPAESSILHVGNGWYRISIRYTVNINAIPYLYTSTDGTDNSFAGDATKGIYIWGAQLEAASSPSNYQKVVSAYDCTEETSVGSGVYKRSVWAIDYDGSDDSYLTSSVDFSGTDKMTVWAGAWKRSDAAFQIVCELTNNWNTQPANNGSFYHGIADSTWLYASGARGTQTVSANQVGSTTSSTYAAPKTNIFVAAHDISGDSSVLRLDGALINTATGEKGSGNFANAILYVGRRGNASAPLSGRIYGLIIRGAATTDAKVREFEKYTAKLVGKQI